LRPPGRGLPTPLRDFSSNRGTGPTGSAARSARLTELSGDHHPQLRDSGIEPWNRTDRIGNFASLRSARVRPTFNRCIPGAVCSLAVPGRTSSPRWVVEPTQPCIGVGRRVSTAVGRTRTRNEVTSSGRGPAARTAACAVRQR
jgi:hypothetical protein